MRAESEQIVNLGKPRIHRRVRASVLGSDDRLYMICGEFEDACKLISYDITGREGFRDWGVLTVDNGSKLEMGRLWSEDYLRQGPRESYSAEEEAFKYRYAFAHLIRNGITTALPT